MSQDLERHFTIGRYSGRGLTWSMRARRSGSYVMLVLAGERLIGRLMPRIDRKRGELVVEGVFAEEGSTGSMAGAPVTAVIESLALFDGAGSVRYAGPVASGVS